MVFILYIVGAADITSQGRIVITGLFKEHIDQVCLVVDVAAEMILVIPIQDDNPNDFGFIQPVDEKNRLIIPKWIIKELGNCGKLFFVIDGDKHYLSPKTGPILPTEDDPASR